MSDDRPKRTFSERDRMRREGGGDPAGRPRGKAAEARVRQATTEYLKEADKLFASGAGGAEGERLAGEIRKSHGTPELAGACRAYLEALGPPRDASLLALFLDTGDSELAVLALQALLELRREGALEPSAGLRSQLRVLEQGFDDAVAEAAEDLLAEL
ncbi:MAG: hypothetical protein ACQGVK_22650 [Myxococcota bacterium]